MTFREMAFDNDGFAAHRHREEESMLQSIFNNQSPIMKLWFAIMALNLAVCLFIF